MADARSRKTGEQNPQLIRLIADAVAMRAQLAALEERVLRLEAEVAAGRATRGSKRPPTAGPPPLPKGPVMPKMPSLPVAPASMPKPGGRRSIVDISEIAELVESIPPPMPPRPRK